MACSPPAKEKPSDIISRDTMVDILTDVHLAEAEPGLRLEARKACLLECRVVVVVDVVDSEDRVAATQKGVRDGGSDKAGSAGDQDVHAKNS